MCTGERTARTAVSVVGRHMRLVHGAGPRGVRGGSLRDEQM